MVDAIVDTSSVGRQDKSEVLEYVPGHFKVIERSLYVFRAKRADRIKIVWWDSSSRIASCGLDAPRQGGIKSLLTLGGRDAG
jgi:hypothetical protein